MKRYTVIYDPGVEMTLAFLVVQYWNTPLNAKISLASNRIDSVLSMNPEDLGTAIHENLRVFWVPPLEVMYAIFEDDRQVIVFDLEFIPDED